MHINLLIKNVSQHINHDKYTKMYMYMYTKIDKKWHSLNLLTNEGFYSKNSSKYTAVIKITIHTSGLVIAITIIFRVLPKIFVV